MPPKSKVKEQVKPVQGFYAVYASQLPVWDEDQIQTENWGTVLSAVGGAAAASTGKETKQSKGNKDGALTGTFFVDLEGRLPLERFIERHLPQPEPTAAAAPDGAAAADGAGSGNSALQPPAAAPAPPEEKKAGAAASAKEKKGKVDKKEKIESPERQSPVVWHRPVDVSKPFRPVVHRNATPFVDPYATADALIPIDAKEEEAKYRAEVAMSANSGKKGDAQKGGATEAGGPIFELYPETVSLMEDLIGQSAEEWQNIRPDVAIQRYREIPALMEPYDPTLLSGCAETPAEACGSRYSTALRHKLQRAEMLEALRKIPPFLMSAFNSVLLVIEKVQHMIGPGHYVWELIYPHAPGTCHPVYNPFGKYAVKLFVEGSYRKVIVDDALPVDELGRPLITVTSLRELWPAILVKAIFKAFGNDASRFFTDDPDLLIPCLLGNYIPQYVQVRHDMVSTASLLLTYKMQMEAAESEAFKAAAAAAAAAARPITAGTDSRLGTGKEREKSADRLGHSGSSPPPSRKRSISKKNAKKEVAVTHGLEKLTAEEYEPPNDDEPVDKKPRLLCGLRTSRENPPPHGYGSGTQLYTIADITPFRDTLAVRLETTPRSGLEAGLFERERESADVRHVLLRAALPQKADKQRTLTSVWLTLEELGEALDSLVVWRQFDKRYLHQTSMEYDASNVSLPAATGAGGGKKVSAAAAAALAAAGPPVVRAPKKNTVQWCAFSSDRPEEVAIVAFAPIPPPPLTPEEEAAAAEAANPKKPPPHAKQAKQAAGSKKGSPAAEPTPVEPVPEEVVVDSAASTGCPTSWLQYESYKRESKTVQLEYYQFDLAEPLTQSITAQYEYGKLMSTVFKLRPGTHLFRVTVPEMEYGDKITFVSDAKMELRSEVSEALKAVTVHHLSDAGVYPAIEQPEKESIWFKRKIRVATDTVLSVVLSTLLPTENPANHRNVNISGAAPTRAMKAGGGGGGGGGGAAGGAGGGNARGAASGKGAAVGSSSGEELDHRRCDIPIIKHATMMLINLDDRDSVLVGSGGQLIHVPLKANRNGYLLLAYACVPTSEAAKIRAGYEQSAASGKEKILLNATADGAAAAEDGGIAAGGGVVSSASTPGGNLVANATTNSNVSGTSSASPAAAFAAAAGGLLSTEETGVLGSSAAVPPLYGRGLWKVSLRSDRELAAFETLTHSAHVLTDSSTLERGGAATFFRHTCTVTEPTHVSLVAEVVENFNIPMNFRIQHYHSVPAASVGGSKVLAEVPPAAEFVADADTCVYQSPERIKHIFIPDVLLELVDRAKSSTYLIEGTIPLEKAIAWDEYCRQAQEDKFHQIRTDAERATEERRSKDLADVSADPSGFIQQKIEEQQMLQLQQQALEADRASKDQGSNQKRNRSVDRRKPQAASGGGGSGRRGSRTSLTGHEVTSKHVSASAASSLLGPLDAVDKELLITHHVQLILSNPKVEVKNALPQEDCLALLRQHWKDTASPISSSVAGGAGADGDVAGGAGGASGGPRASVTGATSAKAAPAMNAKTTRQQQQQREAAAAEEQQRAEQGRHSRLQFIENPLHALVPYIQMPEETVGRAHPKTGSNQPTIVSEDCEENNFRHAAPLPAEAYRVELLPIRAFEVTPPTVVEATPPASTSPFAGGGGGGGGGGAGGGGPGGGNSGNSSARENRRGRNGGAKGASTTPSPSTQWNTAATPGMPQWDDDDLQMAARGPLIQLTERLTDLCREKREEQKRGRKETKRQIYHYWSTRPSATDEGGPSSSVYPSLIGNRDDDSVPVKRGKGP